ncbi:C4-dicarboxylate ABC transporter permease [Dubosiella newyorkensis]|uniref:C4-dicarboxylate ABC transporter permease n=3 Tax=Dubosiella newyorkensis TaxID=1862672 RepID=A0A1U7NKF9_9FIRM|nr:C4-dicarboxylate ABC transporter permease [Dubosiella newyorkensis]
MKTVASIRKWMDKIIMGACIVLFGLMVIVGSYQIITRYFFNKPSTVSEELLTFSFVWMALLASAYVFGIRDHMRMGFLADKIQGKGRIVLDIVIEILILVFALLTLVWGGSAIMQLSMQQMTASLGVPMGYIYTILPVSGVAIVVYSILNIIDMIHGKNLDMPSGVEEKGDVY